MNKKRPPASELLPLSGPVFQILLSLSERPMHGYAILADIRSRTATAVELGAGTLYAAIKRMLLTGMVEERKAPKGERHADARRRYYGITSHGRDAARAEARRLQSLTQLAYDRRLLKDFRAAPSRR